MNAPQHRADAVFTLPRLPRTAALLGELPGWAEDLAERRIEVVEGVADVVVADPSNAALAAGAAEASIVDGEAARGSLRLLPLPVNGSPAMFVNLGQRRAARYAIEHGIVHRQRWRNARNRTAALVAGAGFLPAPRGAIGVLAAAGPPALVAAGAEVAGLTDPEWALVVSSGSIVRRDAFLLFPPGERAPAQVLKFGRVPGVTVQFERDERGAEVTRLAGNLVARRAPAQLGRFEVAGYPASLETAAVGTKLTNYLRGTIPRRRKLAAVEGVAQWLIEIARETAAPPEALGPERERLERDIGEEAVRSIPPVPATFLHNDVAEENVVVSKDGFMVLDWEWAQLHGLPLSDLVYFGVHVLRIIDGALTEAERDRHFLDVLAGNAEGSPVLFHWIRELVAALELPPDAVGPLVTASWLDRGRLSLVEHRRAEAVGGGPLDPAFAERAALIWKREPALGPGWNAWR
jgi:hypothetical protein